MIYFILASIAGIACGLIASVSRGPIGGLLWGIGGAIAAAVIFKVLSLIVGGEE